MRESRLGEGVGSANGVVSWISLLQTSLRAYSYSSASFYDVQLIIFARAAGLDGLGQGLRRTHDLKRSLSCHREALTLRPVSHPLRPTTPNHLGAGILARYNRQGKAGDLDECIAYLRESSLSIRSMSRCYQAIASSLGNATRARHNRSGNTADLNACIAYYQDTRAMICSLVRKDSKSKWRRCHSTSQVLAFPLSWSALLSNCEDLKETMTSSPSPR